MLDQFEEISHLEQKSALFMFDQESVRKLLAGLGGDVSEAEE